MLGDKVAQALAMVGANEKSVSKWLGRPCKCKIRQEKLNQLDTWARRVISGKVALAKDYLEDLLNQ